MMADFTHEDKPMFHALVTGGTRGIGLAIVERLKRDGMMVTAWGHEIDVRSPDAVRGELLRLPEVDVLVNNAGIFGPTGSALTYDLDTWCDVMDVNLMGHLIVSQAVIPSMVARGYGRVVNMSSAVGKDVNPMAPAYSCSKAAIIALTKCMGRELAKTGVTVNCVSPAACNTDLFRDTPKEVIDVMLSKTPMNRFIKVEEVADLVAWLASSQCSGTTAACFDISGGRCQY